jgi:hypothetical protein
LINIQEGQASATATLSIVPALATASNVTLRLQPPLEAGAPTFAEKVTGLPRTVTLPADAASITVDLAQHIVDNSVNESHPTVGLELVAIDSAPYTLGAQTAVFVTILDNDPPAAPTGLSVSGGNGTLTATWNRPEGAVSGDPNAQAAYEVRFKEASAPDQAADMNYPSTGWVTWSGTIPSVVIVNGAAQDISTPSTRIEGDFGDGEHKYQLRNGKPYHVQVRAHDAQPQAGNGWGAWSAIQTGTPDGSGPLVLSPDRNLLTGLTINDGTRDLRIGSAENAVGFGGPHNIYTVQVAPGVDRVTVTPTWTNTSISQVSAEVFHVTYGRQGSLVSWASSESGTGRTVILNPCTTPCYGTTRLEIDLVGVTGGSYRILIQHNLAWESANDRLRDLEVTAGQ